MQEYFEKYINNAISLKVDSPRLKGFMTEFYAVVDGKECIVTTHSKHNNMLNCWDTEYIINYMED